MAQQARTVPRPGSWRTACRRAAAVVTAAGLALTCLGCAGSNQATSSEQAPPTGHIDLAASFTGRGAVHVVEHVSFPAGTYSFAVSAIQPSAPIMPSVDVADITRLTMTAPGQPSVRLHRLRGAHYFSLDTPVTKVTLTYRMNSVAQRTPLSPPRRFLIFLTGLSVSSTESFTRTIHADSALNLSCASRKGKTWVCGHQSAGSWRLLLPSGAADTSVYAQVDLS